MKDLAMLEEGSETVLSRHPTHYNISKFVLMFRILSDFMRREDVESELTRVEPLSTFLCALPHLSEEQLYSLVA